MSLVLDGAAGMTAPQGAVYNGIQSATAVASTSGTSITFTGIPSWAKRITVMFNGVSTSGTSIPLLQIGSGSVTTSGYYGQCGAIATSTAAETSSTAGFPIYSVLAANTISGSIILNLISSNTWVCLGNLTSNTSSVLMVSGNSSNLSGALDRVVVTTTNGTDTFDAGSINILYE